MPDVVTGATRARGGPGVAAIVASGRQVGRLRALPERNSMLEAFSGVSGLPPFPKRSRINASEVISARDHLVFDVGEDERGFRDVADLVGAGGDVFEGFPSSLEQGEAAFALGA
jgi:hypothetical protein